MLTRSFLVARCVLSGAHAKPVFTAIGRFVSASKTLPNFRQAAGIHTASIDAAARKGTRARKSKGKVKVEKKVRPFLEQLEAERHKIMTDTRPRERSYLTPAIDNVYFYRKFQPKEWTFQEALQNHREVHHPSVYNMPNSPLILRIDMDFRYPNRPMKFMDGWKSLIEMKAPFMLPGMTQASVLAFVPEENNGIAESLAAGAAVAGGTELVKDIQQGNINSRDYEYIVCHPSLLPEITPIRGLLKKNFPNFKNGTISLNVPEAIRGLRAGLKIQVTHSQTERDYAYIDTPIGTLDMDSVGLEQNFEAIVSSTLPKRVTGKPPNEFIIQCLLKTPNSFEVFKINIQDIIERETIKGKKGKVATEEDPAEVDQDDEKEASAVVA